MRLAGVLILAASGLTFSAFPQSLYYPPVLLARDGINLQGNGIYTDSYNSQDPTKSTNGKYDPLKYSGDHGDIAAAGGITNPSYINIGNAEVYGQVHIGSNCSVSIGPDGGIGPHGAQATSVTQAIQLGYIVQDANFTIPDTTLPITAGWPAPPSGWVITSAPSFQTNTVNATNCPSPVPPGLTTNTTWVTNGYYPPPGTYVGTPEYIGGHFWEYWLITGYTWITCQTNYSTNFYNHLLFARKNYMTNSLVGSTIVLGQNTALVLSNGLVGTEQITFAQPGSVWFALGSPGSPGPTNYLATTQSPSLLIRAGGSSAVVSGNQVINPSGYAGSFIVWCAPSVRALSFAGRGCFTGLLIAPNADAALNGAGNNMEDFCGLLVANSVTLNGHFAFHYDEALSITGAFPLPWITSQPRDQVALAWRSATFSVTALGSPPLSYQWFFCPVGSGFLIPLPWATNSTFTLTNVGGPPFTQCAGFYSVVVSNAFGSQTSSSATLAVYASAAATLASPASTAGNQMQFNIEGVPGFNYVVEGSTNLSDWVPLMTNTAPFVFVDAGVTNYPQRYYRSVWLP